jgi:hypothetical protein
VSTPLDADGAAALIVAAGQRAAGVHVTPGGVTSLQAAQLGGAEPGAEPGRGSGQP